VGGTVAMLATAREPREDGEVGGIDARLRDDVIRFRMALVAVGLAALCASSERSGR
jgi:hypothetical protein